MRELPRRRAVVVAFLATSFVLILTPAASLAKDPPGIDRFMQAIGFVESGGRYDALNSSSGAYGKYQIMPSNWPAWSKIYLGRALPPTPTNQEVVARGKFTSLWRWLGTWPAVAHWWLTGSGDSNPDHWSPFARRYVGKVMTAMATLPALSPTPNPTSTPKPSPTPTRPPTPTPTPPPSSGPTPTPGAGATSGSYPETSSHITYTGGWSKARFPRYAGGGVLYSGNAGATATFRFVGKSVTWIGPVGPTRGKARVLVDGVVVGTVDLNRSTFLARRDLFSARWSKGAVHTLTIEVLGVAGDRIVAIDELVVR
ncbi:MAG: transglycosylase family protein [Chloroflexota bacterium]|nr:transglycosylase family protein [Chloroflexota bacterium]